MKKLIIAALVLAASASPAWAAKAFLDHEYTTGQTKTCVYRFLNNEYSITIAAYKMCPYSIDV
jgi:hypothetical protein